MLGELFSYGDNGKAGNVSDPTVVGPDPAWPEFVSFLFAGVNANGENSIFVFNPANGQFGYFQDFGSAGNVSHSVIVGFYEQWQEVKFLFAGTNTAGADQIYAVNQNGQLWSYGNGYFSGGSGPVAVGSGAWLEFDFLFAGANAAGQNRIYAVDHSGRLLSYQDNGKPGNVADPIVVGSGAWLEFKFLFAGQNMAGQNRIYAVRA